MAKIIEKSQSDDDVIISLLAQVVSEQMAMSDARAALRRHVRGLDEHEQREFRVKAQERARRLMQVAGGFAEELAVIGAGQ